MNHSDEDRAARASRRRARRPRPARAIAIATAGAGHIRRTTVHAVGCDRRSARSAVTHSSSRGGVTSSRHERPADRVEHDDALMRQERGREDRLSQLVRIVSRSAGKCSRSGTPRTRLPSERASWT